MLRSSGDAKTSLLHSHFLAVSRSLVAEPPSETITTKYSFLASFCMQRHWLGYQLEGNATQDPFALSPLFEKRQHGY